MKSFPFFYYYSFRIFQTAILTHIDSGFKTYQKYYRYKY
ncbi:Uncharacterised protein [Sphingobacterium daejeonense]|nr:Uncharacterised protein [Sphingobacterium daejeonense]